MTWRATVWLVLAVLAARIAYLILLCRWELVGDEAFYWEWSRRLALCYYEKGPGIAYLIAASTALFGTSEWAVRLPMAVASAVATLALARLATAGSGGDQRVGFLSACLFTLMPAYQANAQICTQDGPFIAVWIVGCWAAWHLCDRLEAGRSALVQWLAFATVVGLGFLFKQSMLLLVPGLLVYALLRGSHIRWNLALVRDATFAGLVFAVVISPMVIWNFQHDWPTLAHTLGHVGAPGGDLAARSHRLWYNPLWTLRLVGGQIGAFGPAALILIVQALRWSIRGRSQQAERWPAQLLMICCAAPSLVLYTAITFWKKAEANWPFPAFATLLVLVAQLAVVELPRHRQMLQEWLQNPNRGESQPGRTHRRPKTRFRTAWDWVIVYGVGGWLLIWFLPNLLTWVPWQPKNRFLGHRAEVTKLDGVLHRVAAQTGAVPFLAAPHYADAALCAFYLPGHPVVFNASSLMGGRKTAYDFWTDTDLDDEALRGRPAVLFGDRLDQWEQALRFDSLEPLEAGLPAYLGNGYRGPAAR